MNSKQCRASGCPATIPLEHLMCHRHWFMLPDDMRQDVWRALQAKRTGDQAGQVEYGVAVIRAIKFVDAEERSRQQTK